MMDGFGHGWGMGWWWIIGILLLALIVWLIVRSANSRNTSTKEKSSLDILKDRYARGEIDKAEFEERRKDLM
ncbi:MAG: SHOCT domain-containing protein [Bacteroidales bacterium]|nr:SHOCT domain-containing protein [Bacteroidales bacterium]MCF8351929.1 SHOCT domain-containing protein [Bacteroidales bacterium]MCF8377102.1 SHOCT domain-containing protein [Bacteroidales bacterium]